MDSVQNHSFSSRYKKVGNISHLFLHLRKTESPTKESPETDTRVEIVVLVFGDHVAKPKLGLKHRQWLSVKSCNLKDDLFL